MVNINLNGNIELCYYIRTIDLQKGPFPDLFIYPYNYAHVSPFNLHIKMHDCVHIAYKLDDALKGWWSRELVFWVWVPKSIYYTSQTTEVNNIASKNTVQCSRRCHHTHSGTKC